MTIEELNGAVYEDLRGRVDLVRCVDSLYAVEFECDNWRDLKSRVRFEISFREVIESTVGPGGCGFIQVYEDHPLLWEHNATTAALFFSSAPKSPFALIGKVYETHVALFGRWRELEEYWYADSELLRQGYGKLAEGPRKVIEEYARVIDGDLRMSIVDGIERPGGYRVVIFEDQYVICKDVSVREVV